MPLLTMMFLSTTNPSQSTCLPLINQEWSQLNRLVDSTVAFLRMQRFELLIRSWSAKSMLRLSKIRHPSYFCIFGTWTMPHCPRWPHIAQRYHPWKPPPKRRQKVRSFLWRAYNRRAPNQRNGCLPQQFNQAVVKFMIALKLWCEQPVANEIFILVTIGCLLHLASWTWYMASWAMPGLQANLRNVPLRWM